MKRNIAFSIVSVSLLLVGLSGVVSCGAIGSSSSINSQEQEEVTIDFESSQYEIDLATNNVLSLNVNISPSSASYRITSSSEDGYSVNNMDITFNKVGHYSFNLVASLGEKTDTYTFTVYVYDTLKLSGEGSADNPYLVSSREDLEKINQAVYEYKDLKNKYFRQTDNISLGNDDWEPIGSMGIPFEGIYDGNNFEITDLYIETTNSFLGLFGFSTGVIKNLTVKGEIYAENNPDYPYAHSYAGGICGAINNNALIDNCISYVNVDGDSYLGGICGAVLRSDNQAVGYEIADITNCINYGNVLGDDSAMKHENGMYYGGIVGFNTGIVSGCTNNGKVEIYGSKIQYVGGIMGFDTMIYKYGMDPNDDFSKYASTNNINNGDVLGEQYVGGITGSNNLPLEDCVNNGKVEGNYIVGGITGVNGTASNYSNNYAKPYVKGCENNGKVVLTGNQYAGGIAAYNRYDILNCINEGVVESVDTKSNRVGGITGYHLYGKINECTNKADVSGFKSLGGIAGYQASDVDSCVNEGDVNGGTTSYYVGGISGYNDQGGTLKSINRGSVQGKHHLGGIVGTFIQNNLTIKECENYGEVKVNLNSGSSLSTDNNFIGGIVGMLGSSNIIDSCVNKGDITGYGSQVSGSWGGVAGIAGSMHANSKILNTDNYGNVNGYYNVGGIAGYAQGGASSTAGYITNCSNKEGAIINGTNSVGGIVGRNNFTYISSNSNYGKVTGTTSVGYIYGRNNSTSYDDGTNINYYKEVA